LEITMKYASLLAPLCIAIAGLTVAIAEPPKDAKPGAQPEFKLPPGWTEADMKACTEAGMPGDKHAILAKSIGTWNGKTTMWMAPGAEPMKSECVATVSDFMDGRFTKWEMAGEIPGMGTMKGMGIYGFDNITQKLVATWVTNCGTNIMTGTGEASSDGKTYTWTYPTTCPITKKAVTMRDVERHTGPDSITLESYTTDPKSGKEYKMMEAVFTRATAAKTAMINVSSRTAEIGCANCVFHEKGAKGCELAVKVDGKAYLVKGATVKGHEWCEKTMNATVAGAIEGDRFIATSFDVK